MRAIINAMAALVAASLSLCAAEGAAQCAACGNPAFSAGGNPMARKLANRANPGFRFNGGLIYSYLHMSEVYSGSAPLSDADKANFVYTPRWDLGIGLLSVMADIELPSGTLLQASLPVARAVNTQIDPAGDSTVHDAYGTPIREITDYGLADLELRLGQRLERLLGLGKGTTEAVISLGVAAPTGEFIVDDAGRAATDQYLSLGRGAWWLLAGLDLRGHLSDRVGWSLELAGRIPLSGDVDQRAGYQFSWGNEARAACGLSATLLPDRLSAALSGEVMWRGSGSERLAAELPVTDFPNGGGQWYGLNPSVQVVIAGALAASFVLRIPLYRNVNGQQPVPGLGGVVGLSWGWAPAEVSARPQE